MVASIERFISARNGGTILLSLTATGPAFGQAQLLQALFHDAHRLAHLLHADAVAVVIVAVLANSSNSSSATHHKRTDRADGSASNIRRGVERPMPGSDVLWRISSMRMQ